MRLLLILPLLFLTACHGNLFNKQKYTNFHRAHFRGFDTGGGKKRNEQIVYKTEDREEAEEIRDEDVPELYTEDSLFREDAAPQQLKEESAVSAPVRKPDDYKEEEQSIPEAVPVDTAVVLEDAKVFRNVGLTCAFAGYAGETAVFSTLVLSEFVADGTFLLGIAGISLLLIVLGMAFLWVAISKMKSVGKKAPGGIKFLALFSTIFAGVAISLGLFILAILVLFAF